MPEGAAWADLAIADGERVAEASVMPLIPNATILAIAERAAALVAARPA